MRIAPRQGAAAEPRGPGRVRAVAAALAAAVILLAPIASGCAGMGTRPSGLAGAVDSMAGPGELTTEAASPVMDPDGGPLFAEPRRGPAPRFREWRVPACWKLYDACDEWAVFVDLGREYGSEPIVLMSVATGLRRTVLDHAGSAEGKLAVTAVQVSRDWIVWEESSVHDMELGAAARWRLMAASVSSGGSLGRARVVDQGVVGSRPRCTFRLQGSKVAIGVSEVSRGRQAASPAQAVPGWPTAPPTGAVLDARGRAVIVDLPTGARRNLASFPTGVLALTWSDGRIAVLRSRAGSDGPAVMCVLDEASGHEVGKFELPSGSTALRRPAVTRDRVAFACGPETADETLGRVCVTDLRGKVVRRSLYGGQDPVFSGSWVVYRLMGRSQPGRGPLRGRLVAGDPVTGTQIVLAGPVSTDDGVWLPILGARRDPRHLWVSFRSQAGSSNDTEAPVPVRCYDMP